MIIELIPTGIQESNILCHRARPVLAPVVSHSILDGQQIIDKDTSRFVARTLSPRGEGRVKCTCSRINQTTMMNRDILQHRVTLNHVCPSHGQKERVLFLLKRWLFCNWMISFSFRVSKGGGGFSISPHLDFRPIVPFGSPIYTLLLNVQLRLRSKSVGDVIENAQKELFGLLRERKGSYSDTLPNGDTILHVSEFSCLLKAGPNVIGP